ncbi:MAG: efflux RND transporter periplasmic adaptor subunit [Deltaproteobacteria bacterium]|nr:efflux RND transporter periplasmic adaptor subunit [Deltaproteobacteria bacterium]
MQKKQGKILRFGLIALAAATLLVTGFLLGRQHAPGNSETGAAKSGTASASKERKILFYRNPMNPAITSPVPAKDEMGMDYTPVYSDEGAAPAKKKTFEEEAEDFFAEDEESGAVPGLGPVVLDSKALSLAGVRLAPAESGHFTKSVRTVGRVTPDEARIFRVQTKISGWVETLYANTTGIAVKKGQPLLSLYSPQLVASQEEFLRARAAAREFSSSPDPETRAMGKNLMNAARKRLTLFDVPESFIRELEKTGRVKRLVTIFSPVTGLVLEKGVTLGQQVEPGAVLLTVADLSTVWVEADFYEQDAASLKEGQTALVTSSYDPGLSLSGRIVFLLPFLKPDSRTLTARLSFKNPGLALKPGMFVDVNLVSDFGESVSVPDTALLRTGARTVVFVEKGEGRFEPKAVTPGAAGQGRVQVLTGLSAGEKVVVSANFLMDSESRLAAAIEAASGAAASGGAK